MPEPTLPTGTLTAAELLTKLEAGYVLERLPFWSWGDPEIDRQRAMAFYKIPATEYNGVQIEAWHDRFGYGSAIGTIDEVLLSIVKEPARWSCRDLKFAEYTDFSNPQNNHKQESIDESNPIEQALLAGGFVFNFGSCQHPKFDDFFVHYDPKRQTLSFKAAADTLGWGSDIPATLANVEHLVALVTS